VRERVTRDAAQVVAPTLRVKGHALERYTKLIAGTPWFKVWRCRCGVEYPRVDPERRRELHLEHLLQVRRDTPPKGRKVPATMHVTPNVTLREAKDWLRDHLGDGAHCPCCTQFAMVYQRRIHRGMARVLIAMWRAAGQEWVYLPDLVKSLTGVGRDESFLRFWDLIEESKDQRPDGGRAGWWRVTPLGEQFVKREVTVHQIVNIYDDRRVRPRRGAPAFQGPQIDIVDALTKRFDYAELMGTPL